jgi:crotonobetaine/carnitine-CoA ligase
MTMGGVVRARAREQPDRVAVRLLGSAGEAVTYGALDARSDRAAAAFAGLGLSRGDTAAVMLDNSPAFLDAWIGLAKLGVVEVPVNTAYRGNLLTHVLAQTGCRVAVVGAAYLARLAEVAPRLPALTHVLVAGPAHGSPPEVPGKATAWFSEVLAAAPAAPPAVEVGDAEPSVVLYTSGTTGPSKGVAMPHAQMYFFGQEVVSLQRLTPEDTYFTCTPLFHGNAQFMAAYPALIAGARLVCRPRFSASRWVAQLRESGVTATNLIGVMMDFVWKQPPRPDDADNVLRTVFAAPTASSIVEGFRARYGIEAFTEVFGLTETSAPILSPYGEDRPAGAAGLQAADWFDVRLVDPETDREVPVGEVGELVVRPRHPWTCSLGYFGMPEKTAEAWRNLWFHTGDALRRDGEGWFYFVDRYKDALRRRGENISSYEVEQGLLSHPGVLEVAVVGVAADSEAGEDEVMAFVVPDPAGPGVTAAQLWEHCLGRVPGFAVPRYVRFVDALPKTPSEKVQKAVLRAEGVTADTHDRTAVAATAGAR